ncbi:YijD family membrane protein [Vibrio porteresiae]|uniref:YijD family membrane protein n=1 Tax=Vibrio porteresiae DSM 19223 TaxID=1123496 RepID=A0ABZ0QEP4_9VIBR|nr:YijD family membrane protein [Vibrio porteresiae]WPC73996.1 YijD family membrane protein [Vibrio porteresiae DSM 19223]
MSAQNDKSNPGSERKTLVLALIAGMCGDAILSWLTMSEVSFSIFPLIALVLTLQALYQEYLRHPIAEDVPLVGLACFFVGAFGHSAFLKAQYPEAGSNFFSLIILLVLVLWIGKKLGFLSRKENK